MTTILDRRASGVLLHPTSLTGPHGTGDLGPGAARFVEFLAQAGQRWWQMLPIAPPAFGACPYTALSAFAASPLLISLEGLVEDGLLDRGALAALPAIPADRLDLGAAEARKIPLLREAYARSTTSKRGRSARSAAWLDDYALYAAIRGSLGGQAWIDWPKELRTREPDALARARRALEGEIGFHRFVQSTLDRQWSALRRRAADLDVRLMGDLPIFVALDSADVWAHPEIFQLDRRTGRPRVVAGVPPDYFSEDGQLWGNPLYDWAALEATGYAWWIERFRALFGRFDAVRVDHFIGFHRYWSIPARAPTAKSGRWRPGPGPALFEALRAALGEVPIVAEDLGAVTPEVTALREQFGFPGMHVLQFAFGPEHAVNEHQPHTFPRRAVVYPGTHDNDTGAGWLAELERRSRDGRKGRDAAARAKAKREAEAARRTLEHAYRYLGLAPGTPAGEVPWALLRAAQGSVANLAIVPFQDLLGLGSEARMNVPGTEAGNWTWRHPEGALTPALAERLRDLSTTYGR